ncbi:MAG: DUF4923 family protein [Parabacteroides sp.]|nr:DUF4923 family protein [Parabacteroides sp.]
MKTNSILLFLILFSAPLSSQSIKDLLKSASVKEAVSSIIDPSLSAADLQGTWNYEKPACALKSDNVLKGAGGSLISSQLEKKMEEVCTKAGITPGRFGYTFNADSTFSNTLPKGKPLSGTYSYDEANKKITLHYAIGKKLTITTLEADVTRAGENRCLLFNADKLMKLLSMVSSATQSNTLKTVTDLVNEYDSVLLGFELKK